VFFLWNGVGSQSSKTSKTSAHAHVAKILIRSCSEAKKKYAFTRTRSKSVK